MRHSFYVPWLYDVYMIVLTNVYCFFKYVIMNANKST
jgi:hypothetical protein